MNRRPGQVDVITEVGYCPSCGRTRNLRREEHHLGALVRTIVTCETCHRTLSSSVGVAAAEPVQAATEAPPAPVAKAVAPEAPARAAKPGAKKPVAKKPAASARKPAPAVKKPAVKKPASRGKATPTTARKTTRTK